MTIVMDLIKHLHGLKNQTVQRGMMHQLPIPGPRKLRKFDLQFQVTAYIEYTYTKYNILIKQLENSFP